MYTDRVALRLKTIRLTEKLKTKGETEMKKTLESMKFKEIESTLNESLEDLVVEDSIHTSIVRKQIYDKLVENFDGLNIANPNRNSSEFSILLPFSIDYGGYDGFVEGSVVLRFKITTSRTKEVVEVSKTQKRYVSTKPENPVKFLHFFVKSRVLKFNWKSKDNPKDLSIAVSGVSTESFEDVDGMTVSEVLSGVRERLPKKYRLEILQPLMKSIQFSRMGLKMSKMEAIEEILTEEMKSDIEEGKWGTENSRALKRIVLDSGMLVKQMA